MNPGSQMSGSGAASSSSSSHTPTELYMNSHGHLVTFNGGYSSQQLAKARERTPALSACWSPYWDRANFLRGNNVYVPQDNYIQNAPVKLVPAENGWYAAVSTHTAHASHGALPITHPLSTKRWYGFVELMRGLHVKGIFATCYEYEVNNVVHYTIEIEEHTDGRNPAALLPSDAYKNTPYNIWHPWIPMADNIQRLPILLAVQNYPAWDGSRSTNRRPLLEFEGQRAAGSPDAHGVTEYLWQGRPVVHLEWE